MGTVVRNSELNSSCAHAPLVNDHVKYTFMDNGEDITANVCKDFVDSTWYPST